MNTREWWSLDEYGWRLVIPHGGSDAPAVVVKQIGSAVQIDAGHPVANLMSGKAAAVVGDALTRFGRHGAFLPPTAVTTVRGREAAAVLAAGVTYVGRTHRDRKRPLDPAPVVFAGHPLANPFRPGAGAGKAALARCVKDYREWLRSDPARVALAKTLRGHLLGCWCGEWDGVGRTDIQCHAVEIALLAEEV